MSFRCQNLERLLKGYSGVLTTMLLRLQQELIKLFLRTKKFEKYTAETLRFK